MASNKLFPVSVVTPEKKVLEAEATFAALPAHDGEIGILPNHAPLLVQLGAGWLRIKTEDETHRVLVAGGFAQVANNSLAVLTEHAQHPDEIDRSAAKAALGEALALEVTDEASHHARQQAVALARAQVKEAG